MKKVNVILGVVLAIVIMFNIGTVMYERGNQVGYDQGCEATNATNAVDRIDRDYAAWEMGYEAGVNDYSDYVDEQKALEAKNKLKNAVNHVVTLDEEEEL